MNGLLLHCGAQLATRDEVFALADPVPMGARHMPIHHGDFIEAFEGALAHHSFGITEMQLGLSHEGARMFGLANVIHDSLAEQKDYAFTIGFRGSHDQSLPRGIAAGSNVFVCDNLCFWGDAKVVTKQTTNIHARVPMLIDDLVQKLPQVFAKQTKAFGRYRSTKLTRRAADAAILRMGVNGIINWGELAGVVQEWDEPSHEEHAEDGYSVWRLFNAATQVMKTRDENHPRVMRTIEHGPRLHAMCNNLVADAALAA